MCDRVIVLKLGGSVLRDEDALAVAVHEVYRWRRAGHRVVAVVSALAGATDALLRRCARSCANPDPAAVAAVVANGELQSAALLGLQLDRAGVPASVLGPGGIRLVARGDPLDAEPVSASAAPIEEALARDGVVVAPGYVAQDESGRTVVLGRGGSDLTALFLAHVLGAARCRLVKDVDGLYDRDPAAPGPPPRRYTRATWDDALATDGSILQHKAVRFAREHRVEFEVACFNGTRPTLVGAGPTTFATRLDAAPPLRVALLGLGVVGGGVYESLRRLPALFEIGAIGVRDAAKRREDGVPADRLTTDLRAATRDAQIVVEAVGGLGIGAALHAALRAGAHVVTANKALVAAAGAPLRARATEMARRFRCSAAVGGSMPLLERIEAIGGAVRSVRAILNGTTNFVLDRVAGGADFDGAVREARANGFAERDPRRDLLGLDAADKLRVIAQTLASATAPADGRTPRSMRVQCEPLSGAAVGRALAATPPGRRLRHVASLRRRGAGAVGRVRLERLDARDALAGVPAEHNAAVIERDGDGCEVLRGRGAGRWPTAESIMSDLLEIVRDASPDAEREPGRRDAARGARTRGRARRS